MNSSEQRGRRPRILYLVHRLPYAPNRGDRMRTYHTLRALRPLADVHVVSLVHDEEEASHIDDVRAMASSVRIAPIGHWPNRLRALPALLTSMPLTHVLLQAPEMARHIRDVVAEAPPDLVLAFCSGIADHVLEPPLSEFRFSWIWSISTRRSGPRSQPRVRGGTRFGSSMREKPASCRGSKHV